jgi:FkbM family methyltransferase
LRDPRHKAPLKGAEAGEEAASIRARADQKRARAEEKRTRAEQKHARATKETLAPQESSSDDVEARTAFFDQAHRHTSYLGVQIDGATFLVATKDQGVDRSLFMKRGRPEFTVLARAVAIVENLLGASAIRGRMFVDVGANIGTEAVAALLSHGFGTAVCCEPDEETFRQLSANIALNGLESRVQALRIGASSSTGQTKLVHIEGMAGNNWVATSSDQIRAVEDARARLLTEGADAELPKFSLHEVEIDTLDRLCESGVIAADRVGMLWLDTEGHEGHVLSGATTLVRRGVPLVLEFHPKRLERGGGIARIDEATRSYTHVVDLRRTPLDPTQPRLRLRSVGDLPEITATLLAPEVSWSFTDLLLLRLEDGQVPESTDLDPVMKRAKRAARADEVLHPAPKEPQSDP